jgi:hypothetical protein
MVKETKPTKTPAAKATSAPGGRNLQAHEIVLSSKVLGAAAMSAWGKFAGEIDLGELAKELHDRVTEVQAGDMKPIEAMLFSQALTLQTIFTNLARRAATQEYLKQFETHLVLALKAQAQCRATLTALAEIKNPRPVSFVKQANIANGPQQVNNGAAKPDQYAQAHAHAGKSEAAQNELLEADHGQQLDAGTQGTPSRANSYLEAVAKVHRAANK